MSTNVIKQTILGEPGRQTIKMVVRSSERGPKGEKGDPGVQGPQGIPGPRGYDGVIQYRAGTGINISDDNIITATGDATAAWGGIQGNIANQTDLQNALNAKQDTMADFTGANGIVGGTSGKVPAPAATDNVKVLGGNGNWNALGKLKFSDSGTVVATYDPFSGGEQTVNITTSVGIGSVLSEPTDVAYVDTVNIVDGAVTSSKIDYNTLKKWVPDYANAQGLTNAQARDYTAAVDGFLSLGLAKYSSNQSVAPTITITIDSVTVAKARANATSSSDYPQVTYTGIIPISAGEHMVNDAAGDMDNYGYFIPGKWV